jgi:hypothetical protein
MRTVTVFGGAPECPTGIMLTGKDQYQLYPCPTDTWNARPRRGQDAGWSDVDYRGHVEVEDRTASDRPYLQLCYRIGDGELQAVQMGGIVSGRGLLVLVPNNDGGRSIPTGPIRVPTGSIRVKIVKVYSAQNNQPREAAEQPQNF